MRRALVTGISGQDGSYLAEFLLAKGYEVWGIVRRSSTSNTQRIDHILDRLNLVHGDMTDGGSLSRAIEQSRPDEVYNLAAQSQVLVSYQMPEYTADVVGVGPVRLLESLRATRPQTRFYQASTSELYGKVVETPQTERTPFHPRSPYASAKAQAFYATKNFREAYGLFAVNGILMNHECVPAETPVVVRRYGVIDIVPIDTIVPHRTDPKSGRRYTSDGGEYEVWDGEAWVQCLARTATWHDEEIVVVHGRGGVVACTEDHVVFRSRDDEARSADLREGEHLWIGDPFTSPNATVMTETEAWLLGALTADGYVSPDRGRARAVGRDTEYLQEIARSWSEVTTGRSRFWEGAPSEFGDGRVPAVELFGNTDYANMIRQEIYTEHDDKRVPRRVLNASAPVKLAFLRGYYRGDGLKAGNRRNEFKSFRTSSPTLAAALVWLARTTLDREHVAIYRQPNPIGKDSYLINPCSDEGSGKGKHLRKSLDVIRKVERQAYRGWMFDLATTSERFAAGPGGVVIHNSPRRGEEFVTRKITRAATRIKMGLQEKLKLGNLDSKRDWGYAGDFVEAMWLMLQAEIPDDYVVATGEAHSVREFVERTFDLLSLDWHKYVEYDQDLLRPAEVDYLCGDATKARAELGWSPKVPFAELVSMMVLADLELAQREARR